MTHKISKVKISIASKSNVLDWSHGEVVSPETINYKSFSPEKGGLFCEQIFGPVKDYACACGKYKKIRYKGHVCERCGVEILLSKVRRERFGHIKLNSPVAHFWFFKINPSVLALTLDIKKSKLEEIIYFVSYVVIEPGSSGLQFKEIIDQESSRFRFTEILSALKAQGKMSAADAQMCDEYLDLLATNFMMYSFDEVAALISKYTGARFGIGASALQELLAKIDINYEIAQTKLLLKKGTSSNKAPLRRLDVLNSFLHSDNDIQNMVIDVLPVLPADLRPIVQLDSGRFTTSDINDLYRRIIIRNIRLKKAMDMEAPSLIINNERRMLQEIVDAYFDNERKQKPIIAQNRRPLISLAGLLKGKKGRFRQNLLGKRVDYSGRSVIVTNPNLKLYQCGVPQEMALTLFKPFVVNYLLEHNHAENVKFADKLIEEAEPAVWEALRHVIKERPLVINRAPSLHLGSFQAFEPVLVPGKALQIHPIVTPAFNADFDGDQMAVHVPLSDKAVAEARALMIGSKNVLSPKDGTPIVTPTQDIVLGIYYLTTEKAYDSDQPPKFFSDINDLKKALDMNVVDLQELVFYDLHSLANKVKFKKIPLNSYLITTPGKLLFNDSLPSDMEYVNEIVNNECVLDKADIVCLSKHQSNADVNKIVAHQPDKLVEFLKSRPLKSAVTKADLSVLITQLYETHASEIAPVLDRIKSLGFNFASVSGISIAYNDLLFAKLDSNQKQHYVIDEVKNDILDKTSMRIDVINDFYEKGMLTADQRHAKVVKEWTLAKEKIQNFIEKHMNSEEMRENPLCIMAKSGARGNAGNITQLSAMRGLMTNPKGKIIELPIKSSFKDGLSVTEFFISTHGARKGMADTALKTADSGYLTRRLIDVAHDLIVSIDDCKTIDGFVMRAAYDDVTNSLIVPLYDRIVGRFAAATVLDAKGSILCKHNDLITKSIANKIIAAGIEEVLIRSVLTCSARKGVCVKCYGYNLTRNKVVEIGASVGIMAAQSIGEPGTQLTMRTFHTGGIADEVDITQGLPRIKEIFDVVAPKGINAILSPVDGVVDDITEQDHVYTIRLKRTFINKGEEQTEVIDFKTDYNAQLSVRKGEKVSYGQKLSEGVINLHKLLEYAGLNAVQNYILKEVHRVYRLQGINISDKYIEIIARKMLDNVLIIDSGDSKLIQGRLVPWSVFKEVNLKLIANKQCPAYAKPQIAGLKKASLERHSFLSAASFQNTAQVLVKAAVQSRSDYLVGLKENILVGNLIPAGTGLMTTQEFNDYIKGKIEVPY